MRLFIPLFPILLPGLLTALFLGFLEIRAVMLPLIDSAHALNAAGILAVPFGKAARVAADPATWLGSAVFFVLSLGPAFPLPPSPWPGSAASSSPAPPGAGTRPLCSGYFFLSGSTIPAPHCFPPCGPLPFRPQPGMRPWRGFPFPSWENPPSTNSSISFPSCSWRWSGAWWPDGECFSTSATGSSCRTPWETGSMRPTTATPSRPPRSSSPSGNAR